MRGLWGNIPADWKDLEVCIETPMGIKRAREFSLRMDDEGWIVLVLHDSPCVITD